MLQKKKKRYRIQSILRGLRVKGKTTLKTTYFYTFKSHTIFFHCQDTLFDRITESDR